MISSRDNEFAKLLRSSEFMLPDSYEIRFQETLDQIEKMKKRRYIFLHQSKAAVVILICFLSIGISIGVGAAISTYRQRMSSIPEKQVQQYNKEVQQAKASADCFVRSLTKEEEGRMVELRREYETKGKFPQGEMVKVQRKEDVDLDTLTFCVENSTYYVPKPVMTDEQLLQIIDFMEKRDYSVQKENSITETESFAGEEITKLEAIEMAKTTISKLYQMEMKSEKEDATRDITTDDKDVRLSSYLVTLTGEREGMGAVVEINAKNGQICGIDILDEKKEHCVSDIKVREKEYVKYATNVMEMYKILSDTEEVENAWFTYDYVSSQHLFRGNVKYVVQEKKGSCYVFLYSAHTKIIYDVYYVENGDVFLKQESRNEKEKKKKGVFREKVLIQ